MNENSNSKKTILKKWWFWCILILLIIVIILAIVLIPKNEGNNNLGTQKIDDVMLPEFNKTATADEKILYDQNNVKITFKGISYGSYSVDVNLEFENNNSETLDFISGSTGLCKNAINEFMITDAYLSTSVDAGETVTDSISFNYDSLRLFGIDEIAEITLNFDINASDWDSDFKDIYTDSLIIQTSLYDSYDFSNNSRFLDRITSKAIESKYNSKILQKDTTKNSIVENLDIVSMIRMENKDGEESIMLETANTCGQDVKLKISDIKFNDTMVYDYSWSTDDIINNKKGILDINLSSLEDEDAAKNIDKIEKISFKVSILDSNYQEATSQEVTYEINPASTITSTEETNTTSTSNSTSVSTTEPTITTNSSSSSSTNSNIDSSTNSTGISQEFKDAMDSYEAYMDEYVEFMKKYNANPTDPTLISQYSTMLQKYSEQVSAFDKWNSADMTTEETSYYIEVQTRVSQKLLEVTQ